MQPSPPDDTAKALKPVQVAAPPVESPTTPSQRNWVRFGLMMVLVLGWLCYAATLNFGFVYDDSPQIVSNPRIRSIHFFPEYFVKDVWAQDTGSHGLYRPLFLAWLLANFKSFALRTAYWHLTTVLMHLLMVFLVYLLVRRLLPDKPLVSLVAAALFALHPSHVEAVAWISGVTEPLSGALFIGSFFCYLKGRDQPQLRILYIGASLLLGAGAMLTKETAVVLPAVIVSYEWFMEGQSADETAERRRRYLRLTAMAWPYAVLAGVYLILRFAVLHGVAHNASDVPLWKSILTLPWVVYFYVSQLLVPIGLGPFYDFSYASGFNVVTPLLTLAGLALATWWWSRRSGTRLPLFLASWFLLTLAPVLVLFIVGWRYDTLHDRYLYLPSVALAILVGHIVGTLSNRSDLKRLCFGAITAVLALLFIATYRQTFYWKDNLALETRGVAVAPHNILPKLNLAAALLKQGYSNDAFGVAQQALDQDPNSLLVVSLVAQYAYRRGDYATAEHDYLRALALGPPNASETYYLGLTEIKMGRYQKALSVLQGGVSHWPSFSGYHVAMGQAFAEMGEWADARNQYKLELGLNPANSLAQAELVKAEAHLH